MTSRKTQVIKRLRGDLFKKSSTTPHFLRGLWKRLPKYATEIGKLLFTLSYPNNTYWYKQRFGLFDEFMGSRILNLAKEGTQVRKFDAH